MTATLRSEWTKLSSLRSTKVMLACSLVFALALTALLALVVGNTWSGWKPADRRDYEPIGAALIGGLAAAIFFLVIGVKAATAEYGAGMMRLTLTATPRRGRVLAAKALVVAAVTLAGALVGNVAMFLLARAILRSYGIETPSLGDPDALRAVLGSAALAPLFPIIGLALGIALRSTAATIIAVLAVIFVPPFIGGVLPQSWQGDAREYLPMAAGDAISIGHLPDTATASPPRSPRSWSRVGSPSSSAGHGRCSSAATPDRSAADADRQAADRASGNPTPVSCSESVHSRLAVSPSCAAPLRPTSLGCPRCSWKPSGPT